MFHDRFFQELHDSHDGFSVVAEYFGKGVMGVTGRAEKKQGGSLLGLSTVTS